MKEFRRWLRGLVKTKIFHIIIILAIIIFLIFIAYINIVKYDTEGEKQMPFEVSKISVISSVEGENIEGENPQQVRWNMNISQNNDFYIYIEKNDKYNGRQEEAISSVEIDNFEINKEKNVGENKIYKPDETSEKEIFKNEEKNEADKIEYIGAAQSKVKNMQMSNQGDLIYFRYTNKDITKYQTNDEELNHSELLKKAKVKEEDLKTTIKFDLKINLISGKSFKTSVETQVPIEGIVDSGRSSSEINDVNKLIFKRN